MADCSTGWLAHCPGLPDNRHGKRDPIWPSPEGGYRQPDELPCSNGSASASTIRQRQGQAAPGRALAADGLIRSGRMAGRAAGMVRYLCRGRMGSHAGRLEAFVAYRRHDQLPHERGMRQLQQGAHDGDDIVHGHQFALAPLRGLGQRHG